MLFAIMQFKIFIVKHFKWCLDKGLITNPIYIK